MSHTPARDGWVDLATIPGVGAVLGRRLVDHFGTPAAALAASDTDLAELGLPKKTRHALRTASTDMADRTYRWLETPDHHFVSHDQRCFPELLADMSGAPPWLYASGDLDLLERPAVAIVGSRNPTAGGREITHEFARALAGAGLVVVSGLARGIDSAAHDGALAAGGMTIAVCGTGLDRVYPAANADLAQRITQQGLMLSEFGLGTHPARGNFPRRNRIIAGLSQATLVIEAARDSGSLITARLAAEAGRDVFALPGSVHNPLARGCHQLIRDGAELVESVDQIFESLGPKLGRAVPPTEDAHPEPEAPASETAAQATTDTDHADSATTLLNAMGHAPARIDDLAARTGWNAEDVSSTLLILELEGRAVALPGGAYTPA